MVKRNLEDKDLSYELEEMYSSYDNSIIDESCDEVLTTPMIILGSSPCSDLHYSNIQETNNQTDESFDNQSCVEHYTQSLMDLNIYSRLQFTHSVIRPHGPIIANSSCRGCSIF